MVTLLIVGSSPIGALLTGAVAEHAVWLAIALYGVMCILGIGLAARRALTLNRAGGLPQI